MSLMINPTSTANLVVQCRVRGRGPVEITLPVGDQVDPQVTRSVIELLLRGTGSALPPDLSPQLAQELSEAGLLIAPDTVTPSDPEYRCLLASELPECLPAASRPAAPARHEPLEAAPELRFEGDLLYARDPGPATWSPYALDDVTQRALAAIRGGEPLPAELRPEQLLSLRLANVAGPLGFADARRREWQARIDSARQQLADESYAVFRDFLNPIELAALRDYYRALRAAEAFIPGDGQVQQREWIHDETLARGMHQRLLQTVNRLTPVELQPSYSYTARYYPGAVLRRHTDRPQCEWNVSLVVDTAPEVGREDAWPISLEPASGPKRVQLAMGDFVLYRGTRIPHWREAQPAGRYTTVCFFHFVGLDFVGPLA